MQAIKDSFYMELRERLSQRSPSRTILIDGTKQPGILVAENEEPARGALLADCFYLHFGACGTVCGYGSAGVPVRALDCTIAYSTRGGDNEKARGRLLGSLDSGLMEICNPGNAAIRDFTTTPPGDLGGVIFWTTPELGDVTENGPELSRLAKVTVFFSEEQA